MKKSYCWIPLFLFLTLNPGFSQRKNVLECMETINFDLHQYVAADRLFERFDTIIDLRNGYFEVLDPDIDVKVCQVAKYNNTDVTVLLAITGFFADEQCSNHPSYFYEISKSGQDFKPLEIKDVLPTLDYPLFFTDSIPIQVLKKYLPEIQRTYLDSTATLENLFGEVFDQHIIIPRRGTATKVTLTTCDYIPRNQVGFYDNDWSIIEEHFKPIELIYDRDKKRFKRLPSKHKSLPQKSPNP